MEKLMYRIVEEFIDRREKGRQTRKERSRRLEGDSDVRVRAG